MNILDYVFLLSTMILFQEYVLLWLNFPFFVLLTYKTTDISFGFLCPLTMGLKEVAILLTWFVLWADRN